VGCADDDQGLDFERGRALSSSSVRSAAALSSPRAQTVSAAALDVNHAGPPIARDVVRGAAGRVQAFATGPVAAAAIEVVRPAQDALGAAVVQLGAVVLELAAAAVAAALDVHHAGPPIARDVVRGAVVQLADLEALAAGRALACATGPVAVRRGSPVGTGHGLLLPCGRCAAASLQVSRTQSLRPFSFSFAARSHSARSTSVTRIVSPLAGAPRFGRRPVPPPGHPVPLASAGSTCSR
jgi:hypothetical protein